MLRHVCISCKTLSHLAGQFDKFNTTRDVSYCPIQPSDEVIDDYERDVSFATTSGCAENGLTSREAAGAHSHGLLACWPGSGQLGYCL